MSIFHGPMPEPSPRSRKAVLAHTARPAGAPKQPPENLPTVEPGDGTPLVLPPAWLLGGHLAVTPEAPLPVLQAQLLCLATRLWAQETLLNF